MGGAVAPLVCSPPPPPPPLSLRVAVPGCIAFSIYSLANEHPHEGDKPDREYTNVRNKPFPWGEKPLFHPGDHHKEH